MSWGSEDIAGGLSRDDVENVPGAVWALAERGYSVLCFSFERIHGGREIMTTIVSGYSTLHGALRAAERRWLRHLDAALCAKQLSADQWTMLSNLSTEAGVTMSELASRSQLPPSSATRHADYLAERGLIFRVAAEEDRRRILIGLSNLGADLVAAVRTEEIRAEQVLQARMGVRRYGELMRLLDLVAASPE